MKNANVKNLLLYVFTAILVCSLSILISLSCLNTNAYGAETGITGINLSLDEDIVVKIHTDATMDDGKKVVINYKGEVIQLTNNVNGVFSFAGVSPQNLGEEMSATLYAQDGATQIGETKTFSVRVYLEKLLALDFENSGCDTRIQYQAMKELAVDLLNYGAAAQVYVNQDVDNLANKNLSAEQQQLATDVITNVQTDKVINGDAWVGAGVRFDYKLGLYFVFEAESLNGVVASIEGRAIVPDVYDEDKNWYVIRYNDFTATNMNDVITAKLTFADASEQTFAYSIASYVATMGKNGDALANLVNATYSYGFAAVAYVADYTEINPTFESDGALVMYDDKGYDFSQSKYGTVVIPALNTTDYTVSSTRAGGSDVSPVINTKYTLNSDLVEYTCEVSSGNALCYSDGGEYIYYSEYTYSQLNSDTLTVTYDATAGYTLKTTKAITLREVRGFGLPVTLIGDVTIDLGTGAERDNVWRHNVGVIIGTDSETANVTVAGTGSTYTYGVGLWNGADLTVNKGSTLTINSSSSKKGIGNSTEGTEITIDGTLNTTGIYTKAVITINANGNINLSDTNSITGIINVNGTLTTNNALTLKDGSNINLGAKGVLSVGASAVKQAPSVNVGKTLALTGALITSAKSNVTIEEGGKFTHSKALTLTSGSKLLVDGTMTVGGALTCGGSYTNDATCEYGIDVSAFIRKGSLTVSGQFNVNTLQVGSERDGYSGTLSVSASDNPIKYQDKAGAMRYLFSKGTVTINSSATGKTAMALRTTSADGAHLIIGKGMTLNTTSQFTNVVGFWENNGGNHVVINEDSKINLHADTAHFIRYTASPTATTVVLIKSIKATVDGVEKQVDVAKVLKYTATSGTKYHEASANVFSNLTDGATITSTTTTINIPMHGAYVLADDGATYFQIKG